MKLTELCDEIDRLDKVATKTPWASEDFGELLLVPDCPTEMDTCWSYEMKKDNRDLIARYRTSAPKLAKAARVMHQYILAFCGGAHLKYPTTPCGACSKLKEVEEILE